jgi:hypothetical protein
MRIEALLQRLETEQARLAHEALKQPAASTEFEYGRVVGMYAGLERAKYTIVRLFEDKEKRDFDL